MNRLAIAVILAMLAVPTVAAGQNPPPAPPPGAVWIEGHSELIAAQVDVPAHYVWVPGHWCCPPGAGLVWVADRWELHWNHWTKYPGGWVRAKHLLPQTPNPTCANCDL